MQSEQECKALPRRNLYSAQASLPAVPEGSYVAPGSQLRFPTPRVPPARGAACAGLGSPDYYLDTSADKGGCAIS